MRFIKKTTEKQTQSQFINSSTRENKTFVVIRKVIVLPSTGKARLEKPDYLFIPTKTVAKRISRFQKSTP